MWFNITSVLGLLISIFIVSILLKSKRGEHLLRVLTVILLIVKIAEYIYMNISSGFTYPLEISAITYFMFSIIVLFRMKKLYHIAAFFGVISGIGFFLYYSTLGFISAFYFEMLRHYVAIMAHGILFIGGVYLLVNHDFKKTNKKDLLLTMVLILAHASIFYTDAIEGTTFIYFLIRPEFLMISSYELLNHLLMILYYLLTFSVFITVINKFYVINSLYYQKHTLNISS